MVTNDFNLNKVAQVHGVEVLNINELANALKPVVLPGETMRVFILKEGKEYNQGVAYLDDGTMVVVDNAKRQIAKTIDITVTSVLADHRRQDDFRQIRRAPPGEALVAAANALAGGGTSAAGEGADSSGRLIRRLPARAAVRLRVREWYLGLPALGSPMMEKTNQ